MSEGSQRVRTRPPATSASSLAGVDWRCGDGQSGWSEAAVPRLASLCRCRLIRARDCWRWRFEGSSAFWATRLGQTPQVVAASHTPPLGLEKSAAGAPGSPYAETCKDREREDAEAHATCFSIVPAYGFPKMRAHFAGNRRNDGLLPVGGELPPVVGDPSIEHRDTNCAKGRNDPSAANVPPVSRVVRQDAGLS